MSFLYKAVAAATVFLTFTGAASATSVYEFSFSAENPYVPVVVTGQLTLPDGDGVFAAETLFITSIEGLRIEPDGHFGTTAWRGDFAGTAEFNAFEVLDGAVYVVTFYSRLGADLDFLR
ncbi:hypothetical protein ACQ5SO_02695 [Rhodovulum sp. DZ06]|uniref:hypothetical protein n=1 Tax=Rhodovulum sp. DZ06 TaxID=3425126 RepID=UPI003D34EB23